jgi:hypothetical protein
MNNRNDINTAGLFSMKLITAEELADSLKVPVSWVYNYMRMSGLERLQFYRLDEYERFAVPEVEDYLMVRVAGFNGD